jgi:hypothetical protein
MFKKKPVPIYYPEGLAFFPPFLQVEGHGAHVCDQDRALTVRIQHPRFNFVHMVRRLLVGVPQAGRGGRPRAGRRGPPPAGAPSS